MMPQHRCMDSYPYQKNQTFFTPYQAFPTHMPMDSAKPGHKYEPWPNGGIYGYPMPCHSCCNHGNFSGYYNFRPPYVPAPVPSPLHFYGGYPTPYGEAYPAHYAPPPHYSMDLPRCEYDKNMPWNHHCCGCPNHHYSPKEEKGVKIEEQPLEAVDKKESDSLFSAQKKNYPHPITWIPQEYLHSKGQRSSLEPEVTKHEKVSSKTEQPESIKSWEQEPRIWNGWFPLDVNNLRSLMQGGDGKRTQDQQDKEHLQNKEQKRELPFPVIWMPSFDNKQEEKGRNDNRDINCDKDQQSEEKRRQFPFPIIWMPPPENKHEEAGMKSNSDVKSNTKSEEKPLSTHNIARKKHLGDGNSTDKSGINGENQEAQSGVGMKKNANQRSIPVKQIDVHEVDSSEETRKRGGDVPVNKSSDSHAARRSLSPSKPKLPPVCLRVDPLPKKKNGSSRSPSPPGSKCHSQENKKDKVEDSKSHESVSTCSKEVEPNKKEKKAVEVTEMSSSGNDDRAGMDVSQISVTKQVPENTMADGIECQTKNDREVSKVSNATAEEIKNDQEAGKVSNVTTEEAEASSKTTGTAKSPGEEGKVKKKTMSDVEAAVCIQSAYRGFDVRRWEPLKKLKQIAEIRKQLVNACNCIQALETSYDAQNYNKQKVVIGETIMGLLLKLDAIQGLPPSLRDIRKSLAKELITLQEKVDTIVIRSSQESGTEASKSEIAEKIDEESHNKESVQKQGKQKAVEHGENGSSLQDVYENSNGPTEPCEAQVAHMIKSGHSSKNEESPPVSSSANSTKQVIVEHNLNTHPVVFDDTKDKGPNAEFSKETKHEVVNEELEACPKMVTKIEKAEDASDPDQFIHVPSEREDIADSEIQGTYLESSYVTNEFEESPLGIIDDEPVTIESEMDLQVDMDINDVPTAPKVECISEQTYPTEIDGAMSHSKDAETVSELVELPVGLIDEVSDDGKQVPDEMEKNVHSLVGMIDSAVSEVPIEKESKQPNETVEQSSVIEPEQKGCVKVDVEEDEVLPAYLVAGEETEEREENEIINRVNEAEEVQPITWIEEKGNSEDAVAGAKEEAMKIDTEAKEIHDRIAEDEKLQDQEARIETNIDDELRSKHVEKEEESLPASPTYSVVSVDETGTDSETNKKLKEENEKLRKMMEKLLEAGKEQLDVISNLTGRVNDLEKKLDTTKKKKRRMRPLKRSNIPVTKNRIVDVSV